MNRILYLAIRLASTFGLAFAISTLNSTWLEYPSGYDTPGHLTKAKFLLENWPTVDWASIWYQGIPMFRWYGPLPAYLTALMSKTTSWSAGLSLTIIFIASIAMTGLCIQHLVSKLTDDKLLSVVGGVLIVSSSCLWDWARIGGMYPKVIATSFLSLTLLTLISYVKNSTNRRSISTFVCLQVVLALAMISHPFVAAAAIVFVLVLLPQAKTTVKDKLMLLTGTLFFLFLLVAWFWVPFVFPLAPGAGIIREAGRASTIDWLWSRGAVLADVVMTVSAIPGLPIKYIWLGFSTLMSLTLLILSYIFGSRARGEEGANFLSNSTELRRSMVVAMILFVILAIVTLDYVFLLFVTILLPILALAEFRKLINSLSRKGCSNARLVRIRRAVRLSLIAVILFLVIFQYPLTSFSPKLSERSYFGEDVAQELLADEQAVNMYRVAIPDDSIAGWFNYRYSVPQTRGYFGEGQLNTEWLWRFEQILWKDGTEPEVRFMLDWFAVRWVVSYSPYNLSSSLKGNSVFREVARNAYPVYGFEYNGASQILTATNASAVLVMSKTAFDTVFLGLSYSDCDTRYAIPVKAVRNVDEYSMDDLRNFDAVVLYGYDFQDRAKAYSLLRDYVSNGGGLIIETGFSPESSSAEISEPSPVSRTNATDFGKTWEFQWRSHPVTDGVDFHMFSPAVYAGVHPWGLSSSFNSSVRPWAESIVSIRGHPVVVAGQYGRGRVIWSGINLPFHICSYKNDVESQFFARMIRWVAWAEESAGPIDFRAVRESPTIAKVALASSYSGVLFKENIFEDWSAYISDSRSIRTLRIFEAGPGMMYVRIPKDIEYPATVTFEYHKSILESASILVSTATIVALFVWAALSRARGSFRGPKSSKQGKFSSRDQTILPRGTTVEASEIFSPRHLVRSSRNTLS